MDSIKLVLLVWEFKFEIKFYRTFCDIKKIANGTSKNCDNIANSYCDIKKIANGIFVIISNSSSIHYKINPH